MDAHEIEQFVFSTWINDNASIRRVPHIDCAEVLRNGVCLRVIEGLLASDQEAEGILA
jgi:hypothetical protein